tara:strand:+ start:178 stop:1374 length:1197 start_codon:yes stop_codon:yes gene_type:complete
MGLTKLATSILLTLIPMCVIGHGSSGSSEEKISERNIVFPNVEGYTTLVTDLHTHSVFSDGHVWPKIRVGEALRDGLDGLAITEHLEYQPHRADILHPDRNRAYQQAREAAVQSDLLIIPGSEITRDMPAGHINAIFINDANKLIRVENPPNDHSDVGGFYAAAKQWPAQDAVEEAVKQGAFLFWNHPYWAAQTPDGIARINDFHALNAKNNKLHGIEIANGNTYSEEAFAIALKYNLTLIGVSDVHDLIDWDYEPMNGGHRPVTLALSSDRSQNGLKEALFDRRTIVWFKNLLIGRPQHLNLLLSACISITKMEYQRGTSIAKVTFRNESDAQFTLKNTSELTFMEVGDLLELPPHSDTTISVKLREKAKKIRMPFTVLNTLVAPKEHASITIEAAL